MSSHRSVYEIEAGLTMLLQDSRMASFPRVEFCQTFIQEDLKKREKFAVFGSDYRVQFQQRIEVKDGG